MSKAKQIAPVLAALLVAFVVSSAHARIGGLTAQSFAQRMANSSQFQIQSARLALEKSRNDEIKRFARKIIEHHNGFSERLYSVTKRTRVAFSDTGLSARQRRHINALRGTDPIKFDRSFIRLQRKSYKRTARLMESYVAHGENDDLKRLAKETLPIVISQARTVKALDTWRRMRNVKF